MIYPIVFNINIINNIFTLACDTVDAYKSGIYCEIL